MVLHGGRGAQCGLASAPLADSKPSSPADKPHARRFGATSAPERAQLELESTERFRADAHVAFVSLSLPEASRLKRQHLERSGQRIDEPSVRYAFTRVDA